MSEGLQTFAAAGLTVGLSVLYGAALCRSRDSGWNWAAPAVGLATLIVLAWTAIRLPGHGTTAAVVLVVAAIAALVRLRGHVEPRRLIVGIPTAAMAFAATTLPFVANHRFGALGVTVNDDLALHMEFAGALERGGGIGHLGLDVNYPVGPHSAVAAIIGLLGMNPEPAFAGFILALPVLTALTALAALDHLPGRLQPIGAVMVGLGYLGVAYVVQAAYKESVMALLALGFAVLLRQNLRDGDGALRFAIPGLLLVLAGISTYSIPAGAWFVAIGVLVLVATRARQGLLLERRLGLTIGGSVLALAVLLAVSEHFTSFFSHGPGSLIINSAPNARTGETGGGNFTGIGTVSPLEGLGFWPSADFRLRPPGDGWHLGIGLAILATSIGTARTILRRDVALVAAAVGVLAVYALSAAVSIPYISAKALVIAAPLVMLTAISGLLLPARRNWPRLALAVLAAVFVLTAGASSVLALRGAMVRPDRGPSTDLGTFRDEVAGLRTLFIGRDNYAAWELRRTRIGYLGSGARADLIGRFPQNGSTPNADLDSLTTFELNMYPRLITPRTLYTSLPGKEFKLLRTSRWYRLYKRVARSPRRVSLGALGAPGAYLRCSTADGRRLVRDGGKALVRPAPVIGPIGAWTFDNGGQAPSSSPVALAGNSERMFQTLDLPPGRWEISLAWASPLFINLTVGGHRLPTLPPYVSDGYQHWRVASVRGGRRVEVAIAPAPERRIDIRRGVQMGIIAAVREDKPARLVDVRRACGRWVDWIQH
jgi:hypothetical protein